VKSVVRGTDWSMTGLTGAVVIESADITLQKLEAAFGDKGRFTAKALVSFTKGPSPYDLAGDFSLTEFDAGKLFKAFEPAKPPAVEGVFTVAGRFTGNGETLGRTVERSRGTFELTSRAGVFRGLQRTTNKISMASKAVDLVGSLFGSSKVVEKVAGSAYVVDQLASALGEFNYDQLSVKLSRDESLNVALEDISLLSPEIRLIGKGRSPTWRASRCWSSRSRLRCARRAREDRGAAGQVARAQRGPGRAGLREGEGSGHVRRHAGPARPDGLFHAARHQQAERPADPGQLI